MPNPIPHPTTSPNPVRVRRLGDLPGPRPLPVIGNLIRPTSAVAQFESWAETYGDTYRFRVGSQEAVAISEAEIARAILRDRPDGFTRPLRGNDILADLGILGVFAAEGADWQRQRRLLNPSFHGRHLDTFADPIRKTTERLRDYWMRTAKKADPAGEDILGDLMRYSVDVTSVVSFGHDLNTVSRGDSRLQDKLSRIFEVVQYRLNSPVEYWRLPVITRPTRRLIQWLRRFRRDLLREARASLAAHPERREKPHTLLESMLVASADEEARHPLTDEEVSANVVTLLLAGEDTTANTLAWMLYHLATHSEVRRRARGEVDSILGDASVPTLEQARQLRYIDAVTHETLRMTPPTPVIGAQPTSDKVVGGLHIPEGTLVLLLSRRISMSPKNFDRPHVFDPQRWLDATPEQRRQRKRMMMAFGSGPRVCPGRSLALLECAMVTAMVLRTFDFEVADPSAPVGERTSFTQQPAGIRLRFRPRHIAA